MARDNRRNDRQEAPSREVVQNAPPKAKMVSFDQFWASCVKNGTPVLKESFRAHLKSMGWLNKPDRWVAGALHFGIKMEK